MSRRALAMGSAAIAVLALVAYAAFEAGSEHARTTRSGAAATGGTVATATATRVAPSGTASPSAMKAGDVDPANGKRVLYWHDPMVPGQKFDKPGKSPFMDMELVAVYADDGAGTGGVAIDPRLQQNLGIRTTKAVTGSLSSAISAVGNVAYNERDVVLVQARSNGFVEKLFVRAALDPVRKGQPLAELYVPEWIAAQEEYLAAKRLHTDVDALALGGLADAAAQRMRLAGMSDQQIREVDARGSVQPRFTITSPIDGVVGELSAREGMTVATGAPLFRLNGVATVWVNAEVPERAAALVRPGDAVEARAPALPGSAFNGHVSAILPEVNATTRTLKARIELKNAGGRLVPGMFATIDFAPAQRKDTVLVPSEAVIRTGTRTVVIVAQGDGRFAPVDVEAGFESNGQTEIRHGVRAGDSVVVSGQFLIGSEANLKAAITRMSGMPANRASDMGDAMTGEGNADDRHAGHDAHGAPAGHDAPAGHGAPAGHDAPARHDAPAGRNGHMKHDAHMGHDASPRAK
jgi:membrane fusion protein, copper/silver efflux system